jgi:8-oxo-dGTP diphosphatase
VERQEYVVGFLFNEDKSRVLLIRKNRPEWMAGQLNGVGGKIELGESPLSAMEREFWEEAGLVGLRWNEIGVLVSPRSRIFVFEATGEPDQATTQTDEPLVVFDVVNLSGASDLLPNLRWILPALIDGQAKRLFVEYAA